jgi:hypothetical protein
MYFIVYLANAKLKNIVDTGGVWKSKSLTDKDSELIACVNKISPAVKTVGFTDLKVVKTELPLDYLEEGLLGHLPFDGRILIEEYYKALYLNDEDPETYNINYWQDYFKVSTQTLRNIFNYIFFPIPDPKNPTEVAKILYFKDFNLANRRKLIGDMSEQEYKEYMEQTEDRPELQELKRLDYIKYQKTATEPRMSERTVPYTYEELDAMDENIMQSPLMQEIDKQIEMLVKKESTNMQLDKDIVIALEQLKQKRIEVAKQLEHDQAIQKPVEKDQTDTQKPGGEYQNNTNKSVEEDKSNTNKLVEEDKENNVK